MKKLCLAALAAVALAGCSDNKEEEKTAAEPVRGVTDSEIKLGGMHDLSGVFAAFSSPAVQVANEMFDEVNAEGGIHGRKIRYIVEDHAYQVPKATQAINKLVSRDEVFAALMNLGTPHNLAAFPVMDSNNVPSILPLALSRPMETEGDFSRRFVFGPSYYEGVLKGASWMAEYGDPDNPDDWAFISLYSPYQNLREGVAYPRPLFTTTTRDDRVHPGHARKMVSPNPQAAPWLAVDRRCERVRRCDR